MQTLNSALSSESWGFDLNIVSGSDFRYLPGVYALFNSAIINGFKGQFIILLSDEVEPEIVPRHPQMSVLQYQQQKDVFTTVSKLGLLSSLPNGNYLLLDADFIIERPCGELLEPILNGLLVSTEPESKYDPYDVIVYHQCKELGFSTDLPPYPYINCGLLGFSLPRDQLFMQDYADLTSKFLKGVQKVCSHPYFQFPEQDILNLLVRQQMQKEKKVFSISPKILELGPFGRYMQQRPFPYTLQKNLMPLDQIKYFIHGASLRRPWLQQIKEDSLKQRLRNWLENYGVGAWYRKPFPYERAWAYYACSEEMPIPVSAWAERHSFTAYKHWLWRKAYGL